MLELNMAPDGRIWVGSARIDSDDRVTVLTFPQDARYNGLRFGRDSNIWVVAIDRTTGESLGIVNFTPTGSRGATAWPFKASSPSASPSPYVACTSPPTPTPPLPPHTGTIYYVYAAAEGGIWGYWADSSGRLVRLRGSPFDAKGSGVTLTIDPTGRFLYSGSWYDGIFGYSIDPNDGSLHPIAGSPFNEPSGPSTIAIDAGGRYAYANDLNGKSVSVYAIDDQSGALRAIPGSPFSVDGWPFEVTLNPSAHVVYVNLRDRLETYSDADRGFRRLARIKLENENRDVDLNAMVRNKGWAYGARTYEKTVVKYDVDYRSAALGISANPPTVLPREPDSLLVDPGGHFVYVATLGAAIFGFRIDPHSGNLRAASGSPFSGADSPNHMSFVFDDALLFASNFRSNTISEFSVNRNSGALTLLRASKAQTGRFPSDIASCKRVRNRCLP
jgi:6-phosphogluconolactonase (cycloisomerase 2 family)